MSKKRKPLTDAAGEVRELGSADFRAMRPLAEVLPQQLPLPPRRPAPERSTHIAVADMLWKLARPDWFWTHIPSGEMRSEATGRLLKRMGLRPGMPDFLLIDADGCHYYLELKRGNASLRPEQLAFAHMCQARDVPHAVARSFAEAETQLRIWGVLRPDVGAR